ncbi:MAG: CotH kinase family protein [Methanocalculus sp.]|uniref:CotH kinase family protein n=1 Tax=Methanocalculus sp. TaxID=2004547 RepID=UPI00271ED734|nr:CotH kinase family protein [Methanocalculus sp.]MDO9538512.1 CotH kinase family protein [Methanocalculus sp.]
MSGCISQTDGVTPAAAEAVLNRSVDWTDATHGNKVDPDYSVVFPEDSVNTMTITLSPKEWQMMLDDMTNLCGTFGGSTGGDMNRGMGGGGGGDFDYDTVYVGADITFDGKTWTDVGIRFKGQSTLTRTWQSGSYKLSFKLNFDKFEEENSDIKNQRFYGFDELNLKSGMGDDSLLKDLIIPKVFNDAGVVAPATAFYRVYLDYGDGPVYFGVYTMIESVEDTLIETRFADDSGNIYKPEGTGATFASGTFDISAFEKKTNEDDEDYSDVERLYTVLNSELRTNNPAAWREELIRTFDVNTFINWLAVTTIIENWDVYGNQCKNFYLYTDPSTGQIIWIPWDHNEALPSGGGVTSGGDRMIQGGQRDTRDAGEAPVMGPRGDSDEVPPFMNAGERTPMDTTMFGQRNVPGSQTEGEMPMIGGIENRGGGMGRSLSLGLTEVGDNWPLIRYLMDDPVYYAQYLDALDATVLDFFEPTKMAELYRYYHNLISPYVIGANGEVDGYTNLNSQANFEASLEQLIDYTNNRQIAVIEFLTTRRGAEGKEVV